MKRSIVVVVVVLLTFALFLPATFASPPTIDSSSLIIRLKAQSGGALMIQMNEALGTVRYMDAGENPITAEFAGRGLSPESIAHAFLRTYSSVLGVNEVNFAVRSVQTDELGMTHVRFNQSLGEVPVFGGEITIHLQPDGAIASVGGSTVAGLARFSSQITLPVENAGEIALLQAAIADGQITENRLIVYNDGLVRGIAAPNRMAYFLKVDSETTPELGRYVIVDAQNGTVLLTYPKLLILDEIGYLPLSREEASLFFRLVVRRYERASLIITSNKSFLDWGEVFNDHVLATAILDRLLHHATTLNIKGESFRLKEKRKAGLLGRTSSQDETDSLLKEAPLHPT